MKFIIILLLGLTTNPQLSCGNKDITREAHSGNTDPIDVTTMATPKGGRLRPAAEGPERSALGQPEVNLDSYQLTISGLADSSFSLNWEEIQRWHPVYSDTILMYCVEGWEVWGNWKGILVKELLQKASLKADAQYVLFRCIDGYTTSLPIDYIEKYNVMLAYEVNGEPLEKSDGFPLRLIAFGKYGYKWAKWVSSLGVIDKSQLGYWELYGYSDQANVPLERRKYYEGPDAQPLDY